MHQPHRMLFSFVLLLATSGPPEPENIMLFENGDNMLYENGDVMIYE